jgi:hypothetical protein
MEVSGQLHAPVALPPAKRVPGTHWKGGWVSHYTQTDTWPSKTQHNITQYREKCLKRGDVGCSKPHAQCTSNVKGTVFSSYICPARTAISKRFQIDTEKRNPYEYKSRPRRHEPTPASLLSPAYMSYISRNVTGVSWPLRIGARQIHSEEKNRKRNKSYQLFLQWYNLTSKNGNYTHKHS